MSENCQRNRAQQQYARLMENASSTLPPAEALRVAAALLDLSHDLNRRDGIERVIAVLEDIIPDDLDLFANANKHYCLGDAFGELDALDRQGGTLTDFWETHYQAKRLLHLRIAARLLEELEAVPTDCLCSALNNLGTGLNATGRLLTAIHVWNTALRYDRQFAMALGNRGCTLLEYGHSVHDDGHRLLLWRQAWHDLRSALEMPLHPEAATGFEESYARLERLIPPEVIDEPFDWNGFSLGESPNEREYRAWCLAHQLFLHPLNDLGPITVAAYDPIAAPNMTLQRGEGEYYQGFFNELKQEYVSARYLLYEGMSDGLPHFSDRDVALADTGDQPIHSFRSQQLRFAFRSACSLFDKIAGFLNSYLQLGIPERDVTFRKVWYVKQNPKQGIIRPELSNRDNRWLRALFAVSLDILDNREGFADVSEPDATAIYEIRNRAEHKYLRLVARKDERTSEPEMALQPFKVPREEFARKAMKVMQTAREALLYLSFLIQKEEMTRYEANPHKVVLPLPWVELSYHSRR